MFEYLLTCSHVSFIINHSLSVGSMLSHKVNSFIVRVTESRLEVEWKRIEWSLPHSYRLRVTCVMASLFPYLGFRAMHSKRRGSEDEAREESLVPKKRNGKRYFTRASGSSIVKCENCGMCSTNTNDEASFK